MSADPCTIPGCRFPGVNVLATPSGKARLCTAHIMAWATSPELKENGERFREFVRRQAKEDQEP